MCVWVGVCVCVCVCVCERVCMTTRGIKYGSKVRFHSQPLCSWNSKNT